MLHTNTWSKAWRDVCLHYLRLAHSHICIACQILRQNWTCQTCAIWALPFFVLLAKEQAERIRQGARAESLERDLEVEWEGKMTCSPQMHVVEIRILPSWEIMRSLENQLVIYISLQIQQSPFSLVELVISIILWSHPKYSSHFAHFFAQALHALHAEEQEEKRGHDSCHLSIHFWCLAVALEQMMI